MAKKHRLVFLVSGRNGFGADTGNLTLYEDGLALLTSPVFSGGITSPAGSQPIPSSTYRIRLDIRQTVTEAHPSPEDTDNATHHWYGIEKIDDPGWQWEWGHYRAALNELDFEDGASLSGQFPARQAATRRLYAGLHLRTLGGHPQTAVELSRQREDQRRGQARTMRRLRVVLGALAALSSCPAAAATSFYVDDSARPRQAGERDHIVAFRDDGGFFRIETRLGRAPLKRAMEKGYFLFCGKWRREAGDTIAATYSLLEAYRYKPQVSGAGAPERVARWSDARLGPRAGRRACERRAAVAPVCELRDAGGGSRAFLAGFARGCRERRGALRSYLARRSLT